MKGARGAGESLYFDAVTSQQFLHGIESVIRKESDPSRALHLVLPLAKRLLANLSDADRSVEEFRVLSRRPEELGVPGFGTIRERIASLSALERAWVHLELTEAWQRLWLGKQARIWTSEVRELGREFRRAVNGAMRALRAGKRLLALRHVARARRFAARSCEVSVRIAIAMTRFKQEAARIVTRAVLVPQWRLAG